MKLGTSTEILAQRFGEERALELLAEAGFDAVDWDLSAMTKDGCHWNGPDWEQRARELRAYAERLGLEILQAHAPFPPRKGIEPYDTIVRERIFRSLEIAAVMGAENIVVHPAKHLPREQLRELNIAMYRELIPLCQTLGITVCTENMYDRKDDRSPFLMSVCGDSEDFDQMIDAVGSPWIRGCLDTGHAVLLGQDPADFIRRIGKDRLRCLHVHEVNGYTDSHTIPYMDSGDWESVAKALAETGYEGHFVFEADKFFRAFPEALIPDALTLMVKTGRYLISRIEACRAAL